MVFFVLKPLADGWPSMCELSILKFEEKSAAMDEV
jgi:hypothetical protein